MVTTNLGRARQLIETAERIAQSVADKRRQAAIRRCIAEATAATDLGAAERIAQSITDAYSKTLALTGIAEAAAGADPDSPA